MVVVVVSPPQARNPTRFHLKSSPWSSQPSLDFSLIIFACLAFVWSLGSKLAPPANVRCLLINRHESERANESQGKGQSALGRGHERAGPNGQVLSIIYDSFAAIFRLSFHTYSCYCYFQIRLCIVSHHQTAGALIFAQLDSRSAHKAAVLE